jgi:allantoate deiminase
VAGAIRAFGLDPTHIGDASAGDGAIGYLEFHIEQGPVLDRRAIPLGIVEAIAGQTRMSVLFQGAANHAGTTPMDLRRDAVAGAAEWIGAVERRGRSTPGLVATVGRVETHPGAGNVIAGVCRTSLDVRHADDTVRTDAVDDLIESARQIAQRRGLDATFESHLDQRAVPMDARLVDWLERSVRGAGHPVHRMTSGAGHDAMIIASRMPAAMLFLRCPAGVSHHPDELVSEEAVAAALAVGRGLLDAIAEQHHA